MRLFHHNHIYSRTTVHISLLWISHLSCPSRQWLGHLPMLHWLPYFPHSSLYIVLQNNSFSCTCCTLFFTLGKPASFSSVSHHSSRSFVNAMSVSAVSSSRSYGASRSSFRATLSVPAVPFVKAFYWDLVVSCAMTDISEVKTNWVCVDSNEHCFKEKKRMICRVPQKII